MTRAAEMIATVAGVGFLRPAPGTWGSLAALPLVWIIHVLGGFPLLLALTAFIAVVGIWATAVLTRDQQEHDPSEVVIDEVAGQMVALLPMSYAAWSMQIAILALWPGWLAGFLLFRLFDVTKWGPVGWADRRDDALGVMLDDLIAGLLAAIGVLVLAGLWHGVMGL